jgi:hypothetical protein
MLRISKQHALLTLIVEVNMEAPRFAETLTDSILQNYTVPNHEDDNYKVMKNFLHAIT